MLQLITQIEGYADTRLEWTPSQGEVIPSEFKLELNPATRIGGSVVDTTGRPITGAKVGFNHEDLQAIQTRPLSFEFGWIEVETDDDGRWEINRISNEILPFIYGSARHREFVNSDLSFTRHDRILVKELKSGSHRFTLATALNLSGIVMDEHDAPIPNAEVRYGKLESGDYSTTESDLEGRFFLTGCNPGTGLITANADQFAPKTITVEVELTSREFRIHLERGRRAVMRVRDPNGNPISGAKVWYNNYDPVVSFDPRSRSWGEPPIQAIQVDFRGFTDSEGRITWIDAPNQELVFNVTAKGFMALNGLQFKPDDREHEIVLQPALVVTGTIIDGLLKTPIEKTQMITGWIDSQGTENPTPNWSILGRFCVDFSGGEFYHSYEEPVTREILNPDYVLRFEAEGYQPFVTRPIRAREGVATLNIELKQSHAQKISVVLPDGRPAVQADIAFLPPEGRVTVIPGGLSRERSSFGWAMPFTDLKGQFDLTTDSNTTWVLVAHEEGFKQVELQDLKENPQIELSPWGAIEGTAPIHANSDPRTTLELVFIETHHGIQIDYKGYSAVLNSDGSFHYDKIPQGTHHLNFRVMSTKPNERTWSTRQLRQVSINAGETTRVTLEGRRLSFRLHLPAGLEKSQIVGLIHKPFEQIPLDIVNIPAEAAAWISNNRTLGNEPIRLEKQTDTDEIILTANNVTLRGDVQLSVGLHENLRDRTLLLARSLINLTIPDDGVEQSIDLEVTDWEFASTPEE